MPDIVVDHRLTPLTLVEDRTSLECLVEIALNTPELTYGDVERKPAGHTTLMSANGRSSQL